MMKKEYTQKHLGEIRAIYLVASAEAEKLRAKMNEYGGSFANYRDALFAARLMLMDYKVVAPDKHVAREVDSGIDRLL